MRIRMLSLTLSCLLLLLLLTNPASAGTGYEVTSTGQDGKTVTYTVKFGGGFRFEQYTAFDPSTKKFVYLTWPRDGKAPEPASMIWDCRTGETIPLYQFPEAKDPLPVIPSIEAMKVCPLTGDHNFKVKAQLAYD